MARVNKKLLAYFLILLAIWALLPSKRNFLFGGFSRNLISTNVLIREPHELPPQNETILDYFPREPNVTNQENSNRTTDNFVDACPLGLKSQSDAQKEVSHNLEIIQSEIQLYGDSSVAVVLRGIHSQNYTEETYYCHLWHNERNILSGYVSNASKLTFMYEPHTNNRTISFICSFPLSEDTDVSEYMAALVPDPCVHPSIILNLADAHVIQPAQNITDLTEIIRQESPAWHDKATYKFSDSKSHNISTKMCERMDPYDVIKPGENPDWTAIEEGISYVYSAHVDLRYGAGVLIKGFGILNREVTSKPDEYKLYCQLIVNGSSIPYLASVEIIDILAGRRLDENTPRYRDVIYKSIFSDLDIWEVVDPVVSFVSTPCSKPSNFIHLHFPEVRVEQARIEYMVCLGGPISSGYDDVNRLVEWVELNTMLGAKHFVMYNHESGKNLGDFLDYYQQQKRLTLFNWTIPSVINASDNDALWYYGQRILLNDCLYRYMYKAQYLVFVDFDEVITPKTEVMTWNSMLSSSGCAKSAYTMAINTIFRTDWPDDILTKQVPIINQLHLISLLKTMREDKYYPMNKRAKYIIKPLEIDALLVHRPFPLNVEMVDPCILPLDVGVLHHYRDYVGKAEEKDEVNKVWDRTLHVVAEKLTSKARWIHNQVKLNKMI